MIAKDPDYVPISKVFSGTEVRVVDLQVPYWTMVKFLLKATLALIPVAFIIGGCYALAQSLFFAVAMGASRR